MKKLLPLVIILSIGITQIYAQCYQCDSTTKAFSIGASIATGTNSFAGGNESTTSAENSFVFGDNTQATVSGGIAIGDRAKSTALNSIVFGRYVTGNGANSITFGTATNSSPLLNNLNNSIMFGVNQFPSLTIVKPSGAALGYVGIGTDDPQAMAHVAGKLLLESTTPGAGGLQFKHPNTRGIPPNDSVTAAPYFWDIYSDAYGLKFNTIAHDGTSRQRMVINSGGFVGIGVSSPWARLHVNQNILAEGDITTLDKFVLKPDHNSDSDYWEISRTSTGLNFAYKNRVLQDVLFIGSNGAIGVGNTEPSATLDITGSFKAQSANITGVITGNTLAINSNANITGTITGNALTINSNANITGTITGNALTINSNANISGTITGNALSANSATINENANVTGTLFANTLNANSANINGEIKAKAVEVTLSGWKDYVFYEDYNLMSLAEVEQFIAENYHLPDVPSAAEVEANGVNLGEMSAILIQKVEELTLYIIQLQKQIDELKQTK